MRASILSIGDELLIGQVVNTNASWLGDRLTASGVAVVAISTIGDVLDDIVREVERLAAMSDLVIVSGGLGPTDDDLTRDAVCALLGCDMAYDAAQLERIERRFADGGIPMNERSRLQARVPSAARVLANNFGSAPGLDFRVGEARVIVLPGVPTELKGIVEEHLLPELAAANPIERITLLVFGPTESALADMLVDVAEFVGDGVSLAYLPSPGGIRLRAMRVRDDDEARSRYDRLVAGVRERVEGVLVSDSGESLPEALGRELRARGLTLATAESCTGGMIGELLTDVAGSSDYYLGGAVAYANDAKVAMLAVAPELIATHGAVSAEVAEAMATGARERLGADIGVAVTGIAGPGGGTPEKPVGTVWIAVSTASEVTSWHRTLGRQRDVVRQRAAYLAIELARRAAVALQRPVA
ncbi:MAG TPA: competence/damage-inducible protein A [Candidatus Kapabacteria bacterium]|nr:competence/damage-inducible protein A [Candidatus Kapabacteria bacterium]